MTTSGKTKTGPICISSSIILGAAVLFVLVACSAVSSPAAPEIIQDTPEAVVRSYFDAMNRHDAEAVQQLTDPESESDAHFLATLKITMEEGLPRWTASNLHIQLVENTGQTARLAVGAEVEIELQDGTTTTVRSSDRFSVVNKGGKWYLVGLGEEFPPGWLLDPEQ